MSNYADECEFQTQAHLADLHERQRDREAEADGGGTFSDGPGRPEGGGVPGKKVGAAALPSPDDRPGAAGPILLALGQVIARGVLTCRDRHPENAALYERAARVLRGLVFNNADAISVQERLRASSQNVLRKEC